MQRQDRIFDEQHERTDYLVEDDLFAGFAREHLVDHGDRAHPTFRLLERDPRLELVTTSRLEAQQRRDRLQVVLHAVVDLANGRFLVEHHAIELAKVRDVTHQQDDPSHETVLEQGTQ